MVRRGSDRRLGVWAASLTALAAAVAFGMAVTTPPRSGPFCPSACITYPYTDAASFVPRDYLWMYPALVLSLLFVVLLASIHQYAPPERKVFTTVAVAFGVLAATHLATDYVVQLAVVQPSLLKGEGAALTLISQYNPHGVFIALEDAGYMVTGLAFLFAAAGFAGSGRLERAIRYLLAAAGTLTVAALPILAALFGADLEYRYEVAGISIDWIALFVLGLLLTVVFRRAGDPPGAARPT